MFCLSSAIYTSICHHFIAENLYSRITKILMLPIVSVSPFSQQKPKMEHECNRDSYRVFYSQKPLILKQTKKKPNSIKSSSDEYQIDTSAWTRSVKRFVNVDVRSCSKSSSCFCSLNLPFCSKAYNTWLVGFWFSPMHKEKVSTKFPTAQVRAIIPTQVLCFKIQSFNYQMWFYHD